MDRVANSTYVACYGQTSIKPGPACLHKDAIALRDDFASDTGRASEHNDYTGTEFLRPSASRGSGPPMKWSGPPYRALIGLLRDWITTPLCLVRAPFLLRGGPNVLAETATTMRSAIAGKYQCRLFLSYRLSHGL